MSEIHTRQKAKSWCTHWLHGNYMFALIRGARFLKTLCVSQNVVRELFFENALERCIVSVPRRVLGAPPCDIKDITGGAPNTLRIGPMIGAS